MIEVLALGAGQDVGRSCIIVYINNRTIMLDCGMHMGYNDGRRFPDFTAISQTNSFDKAIDCIIISHFHLDHCGALPYFTEVLGYTGPIYMTHPTRAVLPILLEDYRKISAEKFKDNKKFSRQDIDKCMAKTVSLNMLEEFSHEEDFVIKPYYAGHVIGAAMFYVRVGNESFVYTGDFNTTPDKHLGSATITRLEPNLFITESTYGSVIRDCRKAKEREFLNSVYDCTSKGGKVLIPIFALGRAQELCLLIDSYWNRMNLKIPIYSSSGLTEKANAIYKLFIDYTNEAIKSRADKDPFNFSNIKPFKMPYAYEDGPMVLFASPGMLHSGVSLSIFKKWCNDPKNLIIIPGYCVKGTIGDKLLNGEKNILINGISYEIKMQVKNLSFSAHADEKGILQIIEQCRPKNVLLVHGEKSRMKTLKRNIERDLKIKTFYPANGVIVNIPSSDSIECEIEGKIGMKNLSNIKINIEGEVGVKDTGKIRKIVLKNIKNNDFFEKENRNEK